MSCMKFFTANKHNEFRFNMFSLSVLILLYRTEPDFVTATAKLLEFLDEECGRHCRHCLYIFNRKAASHATQASSAIFVFFIGPSDLPNSQTTGLSGGCFEVDWKLPINALLRLQVVVTHALPTIFTSAYPPYLFHCGMLDTDL